MGEVLSEDIRNYEFDQILNCRWLIAFHFRNRNELSRLVRVLIAVAIIYDVILEDVQIFARLNFAQVAP